MLQIQKAETPHLVQCLGEHELCVLCGKPCPTVLWRIWVYDGHVYTVDEKRGECLFLPIGSNCLRENNLYQYAVWVQDEKRG